MNSLLETILTGNIITYQLHSESNPTQMGNLLDILFSQLQKILCCFSETFAVSPPEKLNASHYIYFLSSSFLIPKEVKRLDGHSIRPKAKNSQAVMLALTPTRYVVWI